MTPAPHRARGPVLGCLLSRKRTAAVVLQHPAKRRVPGSPGSALSPAPCEAPCRAAVAQSRVHAAPRSPCTCRELTYVLPQHRAHRPGPGPAVPHPRVSSSATPRPPGLADLPVAECHVKGALQQVDFGVWLLGLSKAPLRFVSVYVCESAAPLFLSPSCVPSVCLSVQLRPRLLLALAGLKDAVLSIPGWSRFPWRRPSGPGALGWIQSVFIRNCQRAALPSGVWGFRGLRPRVVWSGGNFGRPRQAAIPPHFTLHFLSDE